MATVNDNRPVNLDLQQFKFPVAALTSITHRIAGIALFFALPILLWMLDRSLASEESFDQLIDTITHPFFKLVLWGILVALIYHILDGIKHVLLDFGWGYEPEQSALATKVMLIATAVLVVLAGVWMIWL